MSTNDNNDDTIRQWHKSMASANRTYDEMMCGGMDMSNSHADIAAKAHAQALAIEAFLRHKEQQEQGQSD